MASPAIPRAPQEQRSALARAWRFLNRDRVLALIVLSPSLVVVAIFIYGFIAWTSLVAFLDWNLPETQVSVAGPYNGIDNWQWLFDLPRWYKDIRNMVIFTVLFLAECMILGFLIAAFLDQQVKGEGIFRTIYIMPFAISAVVTGVVWQWMMHQTNGFNRLIDIIGFNYILELFGQGPFNWLWMSDQNIGMVAISFAASWQMVGYTMALYFAGIRGISQDLREAAQIDGAGTFALYRHIIIPLVRPVTLTAFIILFGLALRLFDLVAAIGGSGINFSTDTFAYHMVQLAFQDARFARGAVIAVIMVLLSAIVVVPYLWSIRREV